MIKIATKMFPSFVGRLTVKKQDQSIKQPIKNIDFFKQSLNFKLRNSQAQKFIPHVTESANKFRFDSFYRDSYIKWLYSKERFGRTKWVPMSEVWVDRYYQNATRMAAFRWQYTHFSGTHRKTIIKLLWSKNTKYKPLSFGTKYVCGRTSTGTMSSYTKGKRAKHVLINFAKTLNFLNYYVSVVSICKDWPQIRLAALVVNCCGQFGYIPMHSAMRLFLLSFGAIYWFMDFSPKMYINHVRPLRFCETVYILKKRTKISYFSDNFNCAVKYTRAAGSVSTIVNKYSFKSYISQPWVTVKLPSGSIKAISALQTVLLGAVMPHLKKFFMNTTAGFSRNLGHKPTTRGTAKNPVDHPHGGRGKSVLWPRTPWGKSTK